MQVILNALIELPIGNMILLEKFNRLVSSEYKKITGDLPESFSADQLIPFLILQYQQTVDLKKVANMENTVRYIKKFKQVIDYQYDKRNSVGEFTFQLTTLHSALVGALSYQLVEINLNKLNQYAEHAAIKEVYQETSRLTCNAIKTNDLDMMDFLFKSTDAVIRFLEKPNDQYNKKALTHVIHQAEQRQFVDYTKKLAYLFSAVLLKMVGQSKKSEQMKDKSEAFSDTFFARKGFISKLNKVEKQTFQRCSHS